MVKWAPIIFWDCFRTFDQIPYSLELNAGVQALEEKDVGEVIIRPSSKGPTHLSMTLKISDGVYTNIDILEGGKEGRDVTSFLSLGKTLTIDGETYEDLDEVWTTKISLPAFKSTNLVRISMHILVFRIGTIL